MLQVHTRLDDTLYADLVRQAAAILGVPVQEVRVNTWDEVFPNTGGPARGRGRVVGHAFTGFEVFGFESASTDRKIKCCVFPHRIQDNVWNEWSGVPDDHAWSQDDFQG